MNNPSMASSRSKRGSAASTRAAYQKPARRRGRGRITSSPGSTRSCSGEGDYKRCAVDDQGNQFNCECCNHYLGDYLPPFCSKF